VKKFKPGYDDLVLEYQELDLHYKLSFWIDGVGLRIRRVGFVKPISLPLNQQLVW
jgi:hypothetical protein